MSAQVTITVPAKLEQLHHLVQEVLACVRSWGMDEKQCSRLHLLLEEHFVNVCKHGKKSTYVCWEVQENNTYSLKTIQAPHIRFCIRDDGLAFNPLQENISQEKTSPPEHFFQTLEERPLGGVGLYVLQSLGQNKSYMYTQGENVFCFSLVLQG